MTDPRSYCRDQRRRRALALLDAMAEAGVSAHHLQLDLRDLRDARARRPSTSRTRRSRSTPTAPSKRAFERALRDLRAHGRPARGRPALLQRRGLPSATARSARTTTPRTHLIPLAIDAAAGPAAAAHGLRRRLRHARRHLHPRLHPRRRTSPGRTSLALDAAWTHGERVTASTTWAPRRGHSVREVIAAVERVAGTKVPHTIGPRRAGDPARLVAVGREDRAREPRVRADTATSSTSIVETALRWRAGHPQGYGAGR